MVKYELMQAMRNREDCQAAAGIVEIDDADLGGYASGMRRRAADRKTPLPALAQVGADGQTGSQHESANSQILSVAGISGYYPPSSQRCYRLSREGCRSGTPSARGGAGGGAHWRAPLLGRRRTTSSPNKPPRRYAPFCLGLPVKRVLASGRESSTVTSGSRSRFGGSTRIRRRASSQH